MSKPDEYDANYFLRGKESGKSLYENYRWMPNLTIPMAQTIVDHCGIQKGARVLDFGCARGYIVKALRGLGYDAFGYDTSRWAVVQNADPEVMHDVTDNADLVFRQGAVYDWVIAKDVLEHVEYVEGTINKLLEVSSKGMFVVVPLSTFDGRGHYVIEEYEKDITHIQRFTLGAWVKMFLRPGWAVEAAYRIPGVKDNYYKPGWEYGNGFITARRQE